MDQGKTVKGLRVLEEHPVETALSTPERPVYFSRIQLLVLEYGNQVYECLVCGYTDDTAPKVRGHLGRKHRSEEHTSELQSRFDLVCRLLLEKKNNAIIC